MKNVQLSKNIFYSIIGLPLFYLLTFTITVSLKVYRFSDAFGFYPYLLFGIVVSLVLSFVYFEKLKTKAIEIMDKIIVVILLQVPSTFIFIFCIVAVLLSSVEID